MVSRHFLAVSAPRGFSLAELLVVIGVLGLLTATGVPYFLTYWQSARLRGGAEELATLVNEGRQLAIRNNTFVCVERQTGSNVIRYRVGNAGCTGATWTGAGSNSSGDIRLNDQIEVSNATANVVFNYLGAATTPGTYTVRNPTDSRTLFIIVAPAGRVTICPTSTPC
jgi:prepilin-type N-terminal cleavage/methylation domain-containing protein